ncbi:MAG: hypothetical protein ACR2P0_03870, partial [Acidimicrobiales bacterium]
MDSSGSDDMLPEQVTRIDFESRFRGADRSAVTAHLDRVATAMRSLQAEIESLRAKPAVAVAPVAAPIDERTLTEALGKEAARVLAEARAAAADRISEAEEEAEGIRAQAEELHAERSRSADLEAERIRADAQGVVEQATAEAHGEAARIREQAELDAAGVRDQIAAEKQAADAEAGRIVREAELARRQILEDLARRRSSARRQIEQLRAGRERLLSSHEVVRRALDEISEELTISMSEARAAAEMAGHSVSDSTIEELEAEIETARLSGLLDTGPVPVVSATSAESSD